MNFIEFVLDSVDSGECTVGIFVDLIRAFDSVLINNLHSLGVTKTSLQWFEPFLIIDRSQYVEISHL